MEIVIKMPLCVSARLIDIRVAEGDDIAIGDILFSYESDGALFFEYSACRGRVIRINTPVGREIRTGEDILTVSGSIPDKNTEIFPSRSK